MRRNIKKRRKKNEITNEKKNGRREMKRE